MSGRFRLTTAPGARAALRQDGLRSHNLTLVLHQVVAAGAESISRARIAAETGLTRATVSRIVDQLIDGRLLVELDSTQYPGIGRPPVGLALSPSGPAGLGLGIKADQLSACLVDLTGTVRHLDVRSGAQAGRPLAESLDEIAAMALTALDLARAEGMTVAGVVVGVPGVVQDRRLLRSAPTVGWRDLDVVAELGRRLTGIDLSVTLDGEANLAALGEYFADEELSDFLLVHGEMEVGAGLVLAGQLYRGGHGWAGQLGHVSVDPDGPRCRCGGQGCLHHYASLEALAATVPGGMPGGGMSGGGLTGSIWDTTSAIVASAEAGGEETIRALNCAAEALGIAVANLVCCMDFDTVVLGGSYAVLASWLLAGVREQVQRQVPTASWSPIEVRPSLLGADAAVIGAALTVVDEVRRNPPEWLFDPADSG